MERGNYSIKTVCAVVSGIVRSKSNFFATIVLLMFLNNGAQAQLTLSIDSTESTCQNNGTLTLNASGGNPPYNYILTGGPTSNGQFYPISQGDSSNIFSSLFPGNYTVEVQDLFGSVVGSSVVTGSYTVPNLSLSGTTINCIGGNDGTITANGSNGLAPYEFQIISGPITRPRQTSNVFDSLVAGTYDVRLYDNCDNYQTRTIVLSETYTPVQLLRAGIYKQINCDSGKYQVGVPNSKGTAPFMYRVVAPISTSWQDSSAFWLPDSNRTYTFEVLDACGQTDQVDYNTSSKALRFSYTSGLTCNSFSAILSPNNLIEPITYIQTSGPNAGDTMAGPELDSLAFGSYTFSAFDACGGSYSTTISRRLRGLEFDSYTEQASICHVGKGKVNIKLDLGVGNTAIMPNQVFTLISTPDGYTGDTSTYDNSSRTSYVSFDGLDPGDYTVVGVDGCGFDDTLDFTITQTLSITTTTTVSQLCITNNSSQTTFTRIPAAASFYDPDFELLNASGTKIQGPNSTGTFNNLEAGETYIVRIEYCHNTYDYDTITIDNYTQPDIDPLYAVSCVDSTITISGNPTGGREPYKYEIISGPSSLTYPIGPQSSPLFEGLPMGTGYRLRMSDTCGNTVTKDVSLASNLPLEYETQGSFCSGERLRMVGRSVYGTTFNWMLPDSTIIPGNILTLDSVSSADTGTYYLNATFLTCNTGFQKVKLGLDGSCLRLLLPVELVSFSAKKISNDVLLEWETASELNNSHFEVLRSSDALNWSKIGRVEGNGTKQGYSKYSFNDQSANRAKRYYYKLKQIDFDGKFEYSEIKSVTYDNIVSSTEFGIYPNPARNTISINYNKDLNQDMELRIVDVTGKIISIQQEFNLSDKVDISHLQNGTYTIVLTDLVSNESSFQKLIKSN